MSKSQRPANPWAQREDGLCPANSSVRKFNLTSISLPIPVSGQGTDATGKIFVLNEDKQAVLEGRKPAEPLALRANISDCVALTLVTEFKPEGPAATMPQSNMHIHHVQFDPQGSDGASAGMVFDQSIRPYKLVDPQLKRPAASGDTVLGLSSVEKFQVGVAIGVGLGRDEFEIREIVAIDRNAGTVTLDRALTRDHDADEWAGTEFVQQRWYPDVDLDNVFWHDHVDGIHGWGKGLVGQLIVEPKGSTYHDPVTGEEVRSGNYVDIRTQNPLAPGLVDSSFRELALWTIGDNPVTDSTLNLRAEPWSERLAEDRDPSLLFSSYRHGDPRTPLPRAYRGDPFVLRTVNVTGNGIDSLQLDGHRWYTESKLRDAAGKVTSTPQDSLQYGISSKFTAILEGGAGGLSGSAGDYLYKNGIGRRFRQGAWGLLRVLPGRSQELQPLPGRVPAASAPQPQQTGGRPPSLASSGQPCPAGAPARKFEVAAVDLPNADDEEGTRSVFVPASLAADVRAGRAAPEPLVLHAAAGECVTVELDNQRARARASFNVSKFVRTAASAGVNAGFNPEQTVAPGERRTYRLHADSDKIGSATIADFGDLDSGSRGLYGAFVVAPAGATFHDPRTGLPRDVGAQVDVRLAEGKSYRDFSLILSDNDAVIGSNTMPYPVDVDGPALVNYRSEPRRDDAAAFSSRVHGDPSTPLLRAHVGDDMRVHVLGAPGSEQPHAFSLGGLRWSTDTRLPGANTVEAAPVSPWTTTDIDVIGGAGGQGGFVGDMWYGDLRRPFTQAGMWGLLRVLPEDSCEIRRLDAAACGPRPESPTPAPATPDAGAAPTPSASPSPSPSPAPVLVTPVPQSAAPTAAAAPKLADLVVPGSIGRGSLRRPGIGFSVMAPADAKVLRLRLVPATRAATALAEQVVPLKSTGRLKLEWRLLPRTIKRMKLGQYKLQVQFGTSATRMKAGRLERAFTLRER